MRTDRRSITILLAEDDEDDRLLTEEAFREANLGCVVEFVSDGEELLNYLRKHRLSRPSLILLDLNMPKKDGRDALKEIKSNPLLRRIPVIVLTTSQDQADIDLAYDLGANAFISKPSSYDGLLRIVRGLGDYWLNLVELPH